MKAKRVKASGSIQKSLGQKKGPLKASAKMPVLHRHAAGIDVGSAEHYVCVPEDAVPAGESNVRSFKGFTGDLDKLVEWLQACGLTTVAMESTGVFWIPLAQKLESAKIEVVLVNARHLRYVPGRKTDIKDCQWLQQLHSYGLLRGSFRPGQDICCVRSLMRHRQNLTQSCGQEVQHMQQALQQMNVHLHHAVSDLTGETGLRILNAILAGERDPKKLVQLRDSQCSKTTAEELEAALKGDWRQEHLFVLRQALETYRHLVNHTAHVINRVSILLRTVAPSVGKSDTWLGIFHRRMRARLGPAGANTATARKLACLIYHLLRYKEQYIDVDHLLFLEKIRKRRVNRLRKQAEELGFEITEKQKAA